METNTLYSQHSKILKKRKSKLGFRLSLGFISLIQLKQFVDIIYNVVLMRRAGTNWGSMTDMRDKLKGAGDERARSVENLKKSLDDPDPAGGKFFGPFFLLGDARYLFDTKNLKD